MLARLALVVIVLLVPLRASAETPVADAQALISRYDEDLTAIDRARRQRLHGSPGALRGRQGEGGRALQEGTRDRSEVHRAPDRSRSPVHHHGPLRRGAPGAPARDRRDRADVRCRLDREGSATRTTAPRVHQRQVAIAEVIRRLKRTAPRWN